MKHPLWIVPALAIALLPTLAKSEEPKNDDVQALYSACKNLHIGTAQAGYCVGFISGTARQMFWSGNHLKEAKDRDDLILMAFSSACPKTSVSNGSMVQAFVNWAEKHPEKWSNDTHLGVVEAIRTTWPCLPDALDGR